MASGPRPRSGSREAGQGRAHRLRGASDATWSRGVSSCGQHSAETGTGSMQGYQVDGGGIGDAPPRPKKPLEPTSDGRRRALSFADPRTVKSRLAAPLRSANSIKHPGRGSGMKNSASDGVLAAAEGTYRPLDGTSAGGIGASPQTTAARPALTSHAQEKPPIARRPTLGESSPGATKVTRALIRHRRP